MSDIQLMSPAGDDAHARLREHQLLLTRETDQLILDHTKTFAETLQFIVTQTQRVLNAGVATSCLNTRMGYGLRSRRIKR